MPIVHGHCARALCMCMRRTYSKPHKMMIRSHAHAHVHAHMYMARTHSKPHEMMMRSYLLTD